MLFRLYLLIDTDDRPDWKRYPYIGVSNDHDKYIHICPEHISVNDELDAVNFDAEYVLTELTFGLDMHRVEYICEALMAPPIHEMTIHFKERRHVTIWRYKASEHIFPSCDLMEHQDDVIGEHIMSHLYPLFEPIRKQVMAI